MQALLRHKSSQHGEAANILPDQKSTSSEVSKQVQSQGSAIMQLRFDHFDTNVNFFIEISNKSYATFIISKDSEPLLSSYNAGKNLSLVWNKEVQLRQR